MAKDIFDLDCLDSVVRKIFEKGGNINLDDFNITPFEIPKDHKVLEIAINENELYPQQIRSQIEGAVRGAEAKGCNANLYTALYEAILNAYQHGNEKDPKKKILMSYNLGGKTADFAIIDDGGKLDSHFVAFVLLHKEGKYREKFLDFYTFTHRSKPSSNNGTGTSFMYTYVDRVNYFKYKNGGLVVYLSKDYSKKHKK
ncbi:ATP-binding protein [Candidatus Woesearchaeota archaeon]|nr:ATP-binding protein [Candidatus Woesearchaeota archaeon]